MIDIISERTIWKTIQLIQNVFRPDILQWTVNHARFLSSSQLPLSMTQAKIWESFLTLKLLDISIQDCRTQQMITLLLKYVHLKVEQLQCLHHQDRLLTSLLYLTYVNVEVILLLHRQYMVVLSTLYQLHLRKWE